MGLFGKKGAANYRTGRGGNYSKLGTHEVEILRVFNIEEGYNGHSVGCEYRVLSSDNPEVKEGMQFDWACNITKQGDMALGNIADFIRGALQTLAAEAGELVEDPSEITDFDESDEVRIVPPADSEETSEIIGHRMKLYCHNKKVGKGKPVEQKTDFTVHRWSAPDDLLEALKEAA